MFLFVREYLMRVFNESISRYLLIILSSDTEVEQGFTEDAYVFTEHIITVEQGVREVPDFVKLEYNLDGRSMVRIILPANPLITAFSDTHRVKTEVCLSFIAVC